MSTDKLRVCIIGAGPSGMSVLYQFNHLKTQGEQVPEVVCFEKQSDWGGLWNFSDETGKTGSIGVWAGGAGEGGGAAAPPEFGQLRVFGQQEKFGQSQFLKKFACVCACCCCCFFRGAIFSISS